MSEINSILEKIKEDGHRLTKIRKAMVKIFSEESCLLTLSEFLARLKTLNLKADRTTVYRGLCFLLEKDIIRKIQLADNKVYYELTSEHHHHLVCTKCNRVQKIILGKHLEEAGAGDLPKREIQGQFPFIGVLRFVQSLPVATKIRLKVQGSRIPGFEGSRVLLPCLSLESLTPRPLEPCFS